MAIPVKLEAFEGPMDLLLHHIEKNKIDIYYIPIVEITGKSLYPLVRRPFKAVAVDELIADTIVRGLEGYGESVLVVGEYKSPFRIKILR